MRFFRIAFLASLPALLSAQTGADLSMERLQNISSRLHELVVGQTIPGAVALVARHGRIGLLEAAGWQDVESRKPMNTGSIFQIMSMTKNFTGVAAMMLVEEGKLELRRPVEDYLPEFKGQLVEEILPNGGKVSHPPGHPVIVWQLMSHTSGLPGDPDGEMKDNPQSLRATLAEAVRFYGHSHLEFEPGARWHYSNEGIATLGRIIEVLSGDEYTHFVKTRILDPLGMKSTFFFPPEDMKGMIALVYRHANGQLVRSGAEILGGDPTRYRAGARYPAPEFGLYSTASDLFQFYQMLLNGGTLAGHEYLTRQSIETMTRVFTPDVNPSGWLGGTGYGLTFEIANRPEGTLLLHSPGTFGHGGAFGTEGWIDPKNDLIRILMVQVSDSSAGAARAAVMQIGEAAVAR
jgi:CubicO group peptidase (beta-lactamase class C family)